MRLFFVSRLFIVMCVTALLAMPAQGAQATWTDWTNSSVLNMTVTGAMDDVDVTYTGNFYFAQLGEGTNYWTEPNTASRPYTGSAAVDNAPTPSEMIALCNETYNKVVFSEPVTNPIMAILSMGNSASGCEVTYDFGDTPFTLLSQGQGYWGNGTCSIVDNTLIGHELHGIIQFQGTLSEINWISSQEHWHGFTIGVVPEPSTITLLATGILGLLSYRRKR